ncbi:MAG: putative baseplate assembly protein [Bacillota bacterium]
MLPMPQLDDKTFEQLVEDAKKWIPRYAPGWTDHHIHDPGITIIELFAWLTEMQHYFLDQVREDGERKFLKLLGVKPLPVKPAYVDLTFTVPSGSGTIEVPAGTRVATGELVFETTEPLAVVDTILSKVISQSKYGFIDQSDANERGGIRFYPFGSRAETESRMYIGFDKPIGAGVKLAVTFHLFDDYPVPRGSSADKSDEPLPSAKLLWEYYAGEEEGGWKPLAPEKDGTAELAKSGRTTFVWPGDAKARALSPAVGVPHYWIRATVMQSGYELAPRVDRILINTAAAEQTETAGEPIGRSNGLPSQTFPLSRYPVIPDSLVLQVKEQSASGEVWVDWIRVDDFDASRPNDKHYVLDAETGTVLFGDGRYGAIPQTADERRKDNVRAFVYKSTAGNKGNIPPSSRWTVLSERAGQEKLVAANRLAAAGGRSAETLDESKLRARRELYAVDRAITSEDYEQLAKSTPGLRVARAKAVPLVGKDGTLEEGSVTVVVVPYGEHPYPMPSSSFLRSVCRHLDGRRLIGTRLRVEPPVYVSVTVDAVIQVKSGYHVSATVTKVEQTLLAFLHPLIGGADGTGWPFGRAVYRSELFEAIGKVDGVGCISSLRFTGTGPGLHEDGDGNLLISPLSLVCSESHRIEAAAESAVCSVQGG